MDRMSGHVFICTLLVTLLVGSEVNAVTRKIKDANYWVKQAREDLGRVLAAEKIENVAKNIVIVIGDGYGIETLTATRIYKGELNGNKMDDEVNLHHDEFPNVALARTMCSDRMVGSSGCIASAMLNGVKTRDSTINVDDTIEFKNCEQHMKNKNRNTETLISIASKSGRATGIVTNTRITHATPAAVFGHSASRYWENDADTPQNCKRVGYKDLARQLVEENHYINVLFGGGRRGMLPNNVTDSGGKPGRRLDNRNLLEEWKRTQQKKGKTNQYVSNLDGFNKIDLNTEYVMGLFASSELPYEEDRKVPEDGPSLSEMTSKAIKLLRKNTGGFFLVVESGLIDYGHHASQARYALAEGVEMDRVVKKVLELTDKQDTLLIVTADHGHVFNIGGYPEIELPILGVSHQMSDIDTMPYTILSYGNGPSFNRSYPLGRQNLTEVDTTVLTYRQEAAVPNKDETHAGGDVAVFGHGTMAHLVRGVHQQTFISQVMRYAGCLKPYHDTRRCLAHINGVSKATMTTTLLMSTIVLSYFLK